MAIPYSQKLFGILPWYSVLVIAGMCAAILVIRADCRRHRLPGDTYLDIALVTIPCGVFGARLYYVIFSWEQYRNQLLHIFYIWEGGLAIYGGVICGSLGIYLYCRRKKLCFPEITDIILPAVLLAQAIGRWGNYFNMEAFGRAIQNPKLQFFPMAVLIPENGSYVWHMATFFYESIWNLCGFTALRFLRCGNVRHGELSCWYMLIYGSGRFAIEQLRTDSLYLGVLRASQWLSLLVCIFAVIVILKHSEWRDGLPRILCAVLWIGRWFLLQNASFSMLLQLLSGILLIVLCRKKNGCLLGSILLTSVCMTVLVLRKQGLPISAGFSEGVLLAVFSVSVPVSVFLLKASMKGEEMKCQPDS